MASEPLAAIRTVLKQPILVALIILCVGCANPSKDLNISDDEIREVSYYPRDHAWEKFWTEWPAGREQMDGDLVRIRWLGANTVRIFLDAYTFGYPQPENGYLSCFEEALALIASHHLKAHVTLFNCWWNWQDISGSRQWLEAVVAGHRCDDRILIWELQNEVFPDSPEVQAWIQNLFPFLKQLAGSTRCTISVNRVEFLETIRDLTESSPPDIYSLHWYPRDMAWTGRCAGDLAQAKQSIDGQELMLGEFGSSSYTFSETTQANLYRDVLFYAQLQGIRHLGVWTLNDFPIGTTQCRQSIPSPAEWFCGIVRGDGSFKPAWFILHSAFTGTFPTSAAGAVLLNPSFENLNPVSGQVENWWPSDSLYSRQPTFDRDCTVARSGNCSARIFNPGNLVTGLYSVPLLPVDAGNNYTLHGYVKTQRLQGWVKLNLFWFDDGLNWLGASSSDPPLTDSDLSDWTPLSVAATTPPVGAAYFYAMAQVFTSDPLTQVWLDDLSLEIGPATP